MAGTMITTESWQALIATIEQDGKDAGANAAGWWEQEAIGGHATGNTTALAASVIAGMDDSDPAIMDQLPYADLSGQWADGATVRMLYADHADTDMPAFEDLEDWEQDEIGNVWEEAFNTAAHNSVYAYCKGI